MDSNSVVELNYNVADNKNWIFNDEIFVTQLLHDGSDITYPMWL